MTYSPPFFREQHGALGKLLGGWSFSPVFVAGSGFPIEVQTANGNGEAWGEGDANNESGLVENGESQSGRLIVSTCRHFGTERFALQSAVSALDGAFPASISDPAQG